MDFTSLISHFIVAFIIHPIPTSTSTIFEFSKTVILSRFNKNVHLMYDGSTRYINCTDTETGDIAEIINLAKRKNVKEMPEEISKERNVEEIPIIIDSAKESDIFSLRFSAEIEVDNFQCTVGLSGLSPITYKLCVNNRILRRSSCTGDLQYCFQKIVARKNSCQVLNDVNLFRDHRQLMPYNCGDDDEAVHSFCMVNSNENFHFILRLPALALNNDSDNDLRIKWSVNLTSYNESETSARFDLFENDTIFDYGYICNKSRQCPVEEVTDTVSAMYIIYIGSITLGVLFVVICFGLSCVFCNAWCNKKYLRRRWYLHEDQIEYKTETTTKSKPAEQSPIRVGTFKKMNVIVYDKKTALDKKTLQSKEVLQELARIALFTKVNANFAPLLGYTYSTLGNYKLVYKLGNGANLMWLLRNVKLAVELKFSLIRDLTVALMTINDSFLKCHGDLRTDRCIIDERFVLRVILTRFPKIDALNRKATAIDDETRSTSMLLWTSPEMLRSPNKNPNEASDVYSFSIIVHEITYQKGAFYVEQIHGHKHDLELTASHFQTKFSQPETLSDDESCTLVILPKIKEGPLRPTIPGSYQSVKFKMLEELMRECWNEHPEARPKFTQILMKLETFMRKEKIDAAFSTSKRLKIVSRNMVRQLVVQKRQTILERDRALKHLTHLMPSHFGYEFITGGTDMTPEYYPNVTIYFNDIVEFSTIMAHHESYVTVVEILDDLFKAYDTIVSFYDVVPLHRVGSSLLLASGVPHQNFLHASEIAQPALQIRQFALTYERERLRLRAGIHTGAIMSGIVGKNIPQFGLFGDTVNTASRMSSTGLVDEIQLSEAAFKSLIQSSKEFIITNGGEREIKGKGRMKTFWLKGHTKYSTIPLQLRLDGLPTPSVLVGLRISGVSSERSTTRLDKMICSKDDLAGLKVQNSPDESTTPLSRLSSEDSKENEN